MPYQPKNTIMPKIKIPALQITSYDHCKKVNTHRSSKFNFLNILEEHHKHYQDDGPIKDFIVTNSLLQPRESIIPQKILD